VNNLDFFSFPDPRTWPAEDVQRLHRLTAPRSLRDLFIFDTGEEAACYMEDALAALSVLPVSRDEWFTAAGYPTLAFPSWKIRNYTEQLQAAGYKVWIMDRAAGRGPDATRTRKVVSISMAREELARRRRKWA
jgi:hypothetical protein